MIQKDGALRVWQRNFYYFKKTWISSAFWIVIEPLIYLGALGYGLGSFVNHMNGQSFLEFFFPGLLATTAMMVSYIEGTYANYTKMTYQKLYAGIMLAPVNPDEIIHGELIWSATKGVLGVLGVLLVSSFLGLVNTWKMIPAFCVLILTAWLFSSMAMVIISYAKNYDSFIFTTSGLIVPMSMISGTYFPMDSMPLVLKGIAYLLPLSHAVMAVRSFLTDTESWMTLVNIGYLAVVGFILMKWSVRRISRRLLG